jgi:hypothetical protein
MGQMIAECKFRKSAPKIDSKIRYQSGSNIEIPDHQIQIILAPYRSSGIAAAYRRVNIARSAQLAQ